MKSKFLKFLVAGAVGIFGIVASAHADIIITPSTPGIILGDTLDPVAGPDNCEPDCVYLAFGLTDDGSLSLLYKADFNEDGTPPTYSGTFASSYTTAFSPADDPTDALIEYILASSAIGCPSCYLAIKDGNILPRYYFFDLSDWNGTETLDLSGFWANGGGAISHVSIWGVASTTTVPEPGSMVLLGLGILGAGLARRRAKRA